MSWRDILADERRQRLEQIERYENGTPGGYKLDSDQYLIIDMARTFDTEERIFDGFKKRYTPWWIRIISRRDRHRSACQLFRRIDYIWLLIKLKRPKWGQYGNLYIGHYEAPSIFPYSWYRWATNVQNKYYWTRLILDI